MSSVVLGILPACTSTTRCATTLAPGGRDGGGRSGISRGGGRVGRLGRSGGGWASGSSGGANAGWFGMPSIVRFFRRCLRFSSWSARVIFLSATRPSCERGLAPGLGTGRRGSRTPPSA